MLSILICSLSGRAKQLDRLLNVLRPQCGTIADVEIEKDNGEMPIGAKRNLLLQKAKRKYVAFVDDDDIVHPSYVDLITQKIQKYYSDSGHWVDCVGICGYLVDGLGRKGWDFRHSITVSRWCKDKTKHIYFRTPNHLNPIRADLARRVHFPEKSWGEDREFSDKIQMFIKTEVFVETPIYYYQQGNK